MAAKSPKKAKPKTMRSARNTRKRKDPDALPLGDPLPPPDPVAVPDPTNAPDGAMPYVKGGKYVLTGAPLNQDCKPYWNNTTKKVEWSAI